MKQLKFKIGDSPSREHGGSLLVGKRRVRRSLSLKQSHHLILKSDFAEGARKLTLHRALIERVLKKCMKLYRIRVYTTAIASNHIHLVVLGKRRIDLQNFFRVFTGHIAQEILKQFPIQKHEKGTAPRERENKFWQTRIYSRIITWGKEFSFVIKYVIQNALEASGVIPYQKRRGAAPF